MLRFVPPASRLCARERGADVQTLLVGRGTSARQRVVPRVRHRGRPRRPPRSGDGDEPRLQRHELPRASRCCGPFLPWPGFRSRSSSGPRMEQTVVSIIFLGAFFTVVLNVLGGVETIDVRYLPGRALDGSAPLAAVPENRAAGDVAVDLHRGGHRHGAHLGNRGRRRDDRQHPGRPRLHDVAGVRRRQDRPHHRQHGQHRPRGSPLQCPDLAGRPPTATPWLAAWRDDAGGALYQERRQGLRSGRRQRCRAAGVSLDIAAGRILRRRRAVRLRQDDPARTASRASTR